MRSVDKLRRYAHDFADEELNERAVTAIADEIEAEVGRDYMPKPKVEKNFGAIDDGVTDIAVALGNIAECNAARAAMGQGVTYHDVDVILGSIAAIADAYYMRLPVDADGKAIRLGDRFELVVPDEGHEREIKRVKSIIYHAKYYGTWNVDDPAVFVNDYFEPSELKHAYDDSLLRIYEDACCGRVDFDDFARRVAENIEYTNANAGLFASRDELIEMTE